MAEHREGGLDAAERHSIPWQEPEWYDQDAVNAEIERVFDICHGCRRCFNLCEAFPTLFDLVDESDTMDVDGVAKADYTKVVDQCYLCDMCFMTKCPYVPPHEWNVDFPKLMLRAKAVAFRNGRVDSQQRRLSNTDRLGKLTSLPGVVKLVNALNDNTTARNLMQKATGIHPDAALPPIDPQRQPVVWDGASPETAVSPLHTKSPPAMIERRVERSAQRAINRLAKMWTTAKEVPTSSPMAVSDASNSVLMGSSSAFRILRSATLNAVTSTNTPSTYHEYAGAPSPPDAPPAA